MRKNLRAAATLLSLSLMIAGLPPSPAAGDEPAGRLEGAVAQLPVRQTPNLPSSARTAAAEEAEATDTVATDTVATDTVIIAADTPEETERISAALTAMRQSNIAAAARLQVEVLEEVGAFAVTMPAAEKESTLGLIRSVGRAVGVREVTAENDQTARAMSVIPPDGLWGMQWGPDRIGSPAAWQRSTGGETVVAVIDTGVNPVSEIAGRVLPGYDFVNGDDDPADDNGHGTMSATVIAAGSSSGYGIAGMCWQCRILPVKVLGADGTGSYTDIIQGILYAVQQGAEVINLSLGGEAQVSMLDDAVAYAVDAGVVVVASAGNDGVTTQFWPAASPGAIAVAGSQEDDSRYSWSNYGAWVDLSAPGCNIAQAEDSLYYWYCGTSSAGPVVAGAAAVLLDIHPAAGPDDILTHLTGTAVADGYTVSGRIDFAAAADAAAAAAEPVDSAPPTVTFLTPGPARHLTGETTFTAAATDDTGVETLELWHDSTLLATAPAGTSQVTYDVGGLPEGPVTLRWRAYDASGNVGVVQRDFTVDTTAPAVTFGSPAADTHHSGWLTVTPNVTDDNLRRVELWVDGVPRTTAWSAPWSGTFDTRTLPDGPVELRFRAHDRAGNLSVVSRQVNISNTPAAGVTVWPNPGRTVSGTIGVRPELTSGGPISESTLLADGTPVATWPYLPSIATWDTRTGAEGARLLEFRLTDRAGNVSYTPARQVTVDNTAPSIDVSHPRPGGDLTAGSAVQVDVSDLTGPVTVELWIGTERLDLLQGPVGTFELTVPESIPAGWTLLRVVAYDNVRNRTMVGRMADILPGS